MRNRPLRRPRIRRLLTAGAAAMLTVSLGTLVASGFWHYEYRLWDGNGFSCRYFRIARGRAEAGRTDLFRVMDAGPSHSLKYQRDIPFWWRWSPWTARPVVSFKRYWAAPDMNWDWIVSVPLWIPAGASAAALVPLMILSARRRRLAGLGRCPSCAYDRAGLPPGAPCPECGRQPAG